MPLFIATFAALPESLRRLALALPGDNVRLDVDVDWLERSLRFLYPLLAIGAVALVVVGFIAALRSSEISGTAKVEFKRAIIAELRRNLAGLSAEQLARLIGLSPHRTARLIEEMSQDGIIDSMNVHGVLLWRMRGFSPNS